MSQYEYDTKTDTFISQNEGFEPIKQGSAIRHKIINEPKFQGGEFIAISSILDDYLGVHQWI